MVAAAKAVAADSANVNFFIFFTFHSFRGPAEQRHGRSGSVLSECPRTRNPKPDYPLGEAGFTGPVFPGITYLTSVVPVISGTVVVASWCPSPKCWPETEIVAFARISADGNRVGDDADAAARWTGRTLRVEVEGWVEAATTVADADRIGRRVANRISTDLPQMRSFTWTARGV
jgi:hypothetical protein